MLLFLAFDMDQNEPFHVGYWREGAMFVELLLATGYCKLAAMNLNVTTILTSYDTATTLQI